MREMRCLRTFGGKAVKFELARLRPGQCKIVFVCSAGYTGNRDVKNGQPGRLRGHRYRQIIDGDGKSPALRISRGSRHSVLLRGTAAVLTAGWGYEHNLQQPKAMLTIRSSSRGQSTRPTPRD